jgi:hypothetical protein
MGMIALNADKTAVVEVGSAAAAWLVNEEDLGDHLVKPAKKAKKPAAAPAPASADESTPDGDAGAGSGDSSGS